MLPSHLLPPPTSSINVMSSPTSIYPMPLVSHACRPLSTLLLPKLTVQSDRPSPDPTHEPLLSPPLSLSPHPPPPPTPSPCLLPAPIKSTIADRPTIDVSCQISLRSAILMQSRLNLD
ncbi:hypothetical protein PoB_006509400 [Plakobranchus ocellatus]|uniref:Uncharacterized protein n=1 Tax=Plakobranchus ocellatus TaxID=259542 RepID=A0AAV4D339_9GAST|nr:hypothetical protein PoB_006509400 [Plakobranchus ocellatus]